MDAQEKVKKHNAFMGTIAVSVVYGLVALILLVIGYFTEYGKRTILGSLSTFTATFIIGTILVITLMTFLVIEWRPEEATKKSPGMNSLNPSSCPDYWQVEDGGDFDASRFGNYDKPPDANSNVESTFGIIDQNGVNNIEAPDFKTFHSSMNDDQFNLKCVADTSLINNTSPFKTYGDVNDDVGKGLRFMSSLKTKDINKVDCSQVYPEYLGQLDAKEYADNNYTGPSNKHRCAYAKTCGVPWTEAGCK